MLAARVTQPVMTASIVNTTRERITVHEAVQAASDLFEQLLPEEQRRAVAMLAANFDLNLKDPPSAGRRLYRPAPRKTRSY